MEVITVGSKIGLFDSGLGGLSILSELLRVLPNEDYLFYEDSINNPYGNKNYDELLNITKNIVDYLLSNDCKIIVVACNTATTLCIKKLREMYPDVIFVGVEPAIKVACDKGFKNTVVLSTSNTSMSDRLNGLIAKYRHDDQTVECISGGDLAHRIENDEYEKIDQLLENLLGQYKNTCDSLVLGCTHYSLIKEQISRILPNAVLIDGCVGVSNEVRRQLEEKGLLNDKSSTGNITIINSMNDELVERSYRILGEDKEGKYENN